LTENKDKAIKDVYMLDLSGITELDYQDAFTQASTS
jgi:hypothetical protein